MRLEGFCHCSAFFPCVTLKKKISSDILMFHYVLFFPPRPTTRPISDLHCGTPPPKKRKAVCGWAEHSTFPSRRPKDSVGQLLWVLLALLSVSVSMGRQVFVGGVFLFFSGEEMHGGGTLLGGSGSSGWPMHRQGAPGDLLIGWEHSAEA
eukprot:RCo007166